MIIAACYFPIVAHARVVAHGAAERMDEFTFRNRAISASAQNQVYTLLLRICIGRSDKMLATIALAVTIAAVAACGLQVSAQSQSFEEYFEERIRNAFENSSRDDEEYLRFEWEGYDGWYNNPAHPDWGGAGKR